MSETFSREDWLRTVALVGGAAVVTVCVFVQTRYPLLFLIPPMVFIVATQVGFAGVALFVPVLTAIALVCTHLGMGPFALVPDITAGEQLALLAGFVVATLLLGRVVAGVASAGAGAVAELNAERHQLLGREATMRLLSDHTSDMVLRIGSDGRWHYISPAAERLIGRPAGELLGSRSLDFVHPDDREGISDPIARLRAGEDEAERPRFRVVRPDGSLTWVEASTQVVFDPATAVPDGYVSVLADISARVAAETALIESRERLRLLLDGVADHAVYMLDPDGRVASWNAGAERIKGYRADEIIGRSFVIFFTPEDRANGEPARLLGLARERGHVEREAWRVRKDGSRFWARAALTAIRDEAGELRGFAKVAHDLTGRQAEEAQRAIMIEAAPNGMLVVDEGGIITLANTQADRIFGYPDGALVGQSVDTLVPEPLRDGHAWQRAGFGGGKGAGMSRDREVEGRRQDGSTVAVQVLLRPVRTAQGAITVVSVIDATERLRLQAEHEAAEARERAEAAETNAELARLARDLTLARDAAEQASEAKSRFLTGVTHELRTPLNGILGYAQLLRLEGGLTPAQDAHVAAMLGAGEHLLGMINSVLDLSQIESDQMALLPVALDLPDLLRSCLDLVRPAADKKGLALNLVTAPEVPARLVADPMRLRQVVVNLLGNAVKFTPSGQVEVRLLPAESEAPAASRVRIEVADTGPGIAAGQRARLFGEFERLEAKADVEGSGLGLAIAARLVRRMGGSIGHADNPSGGSLFWVELQGDQAEAGPAPGPDAAVAGPAARLRVLVVDDVAMNRDIASSFLRHAGHQVVSVDSGAAALEAVAESDFDVVLMDVRMPGMDGLEATRRIRALGGKRAGVPIVALTAQAFKDQLDACVRAGMDGHLSKPFTLPALLATLRRATGGPAPFDPPGEAPIFDADLPLLDQAEFGRLAEFLDPDAVANGLQVLADRGESLLRRLRTPGALTGERETLAELAHALASSAGMFGFQRLATIARNFEHAANLAVPDLADLTEGLITTTDASIKEMRERLKEAPSVAA